MPRRAQRPRRRGARWLSKMRKEETLESEFAFEFEQPAFLTLGSGYEERPRFSGGAYQSILRVKQEDVARSGGGPADEE